jgi:hypothetical protein
MAKEQLVDVITICQTFPELPHPQLQRDHILDSIDNIFAGDTKLIVVEGSGLGKTNILAQFAMRHHNHVLMLFVRPTSRWGYDRDFLRFDLANQLQWLLSDKELESIDEVDDAFLRNRWVDLNRRIRRTKETFYIVVDGAGDLASDNLSILKVILDLLPWGFSGFKFLLSGDTISLASHLPKGIQPKSYPLPHFTLDETIQYLDPLGIAREALTEIHRTCRGFPGHIASVRRILQAGEDVHRFLQNMPDQLPELFEIEWRKVDSENIDQRRLIALIAHDQRQHSVTELARVLSLSPVLVRDMLYPLSFILVDADTEAVALVSDAFRSFVATRLRHFRREVTDLYIDDLLQTPDSADALNALPGYFEQAERFEELLTYLSPKHLAQMLERSQSLSIVKDKAGLGVQTARRLHRDHDLMRFSMQKSALTELAGAETWRSEVTARMAVRDYDAALILAQSTVLKEERLHLLAVIAKTKRQQGLTVDPELTQQIRHLYSQIDPIDLGERAIEIAADLIYTHPDLAIELVESTTQMDTSENAVDWAFAKLSLKTLSVREDNAPVPDAKDDIASRIKDPAAKRFAAEAARYLEDYSAVEVIAEAEQLDKPGDGLYLLRQWATVNRKRSDALTVVSYALELAIRTTPYVPNARDLRQIASPLPFITDTTILRSLVKTFEGQQGTIADLGPTEDYVRLWLLLAESEIKYDFEAARNKLVEIYLYVNDLEDLAIKTSCMAWVVAALASIDPDMRLETLDKIHSSAENDLQLFLQQLLDVSAEHYTATRGVITALAQSKPAMAFNLTQTLNVAPRRDYALLDLVDVMLRGDVCTADFSLIHTALTSFSDPEIKDETLLNVFDRLSRITTKSDRRIREVLRLLPHLHNVQDARERCRGYSLAYVFLTQQDPVGYASLAEQLLERLNTAWQAIDAGWYKVEMGFKIAAVLAPASMEAARNYITQVEQVRDEISLDAGPVAQSYFGYIRLAIRAFSGLLPRGLDTPKDFEALTDLIERVPSYGERSLLWADLTLYYYLSKRHERCQQIVAQRVKPLLDNLGSEDARYKAEIVSSVAPALYVGHKITAFERIEELPLTYKDAAYWQICLFLLRKQLPTDPYDNWARQGFNITYDEIVDLCDLLRRIDIDAWIYKAVEWIVDTVSFFRRKNQFSHQQRVSIAERLDSIIQAKLPNPRYIKHNGWKVAAEAQVDRIKAVKGDIWENHIRAAHALPNLADQLLVLSMVAVAMPSKEDNRRAEIFEEVAQTINTIPMSLDRIGRFEALADHAMDSHPQLSSKYLKFAMQTALSTDSPDSFPHQRRLIDIAYRLDPELAASLASMADTDPARDNVERQLNILKMKQEMTGKSSPEFAHAEDKNNYPQVAWKLLGALNSERIANVSIDRTRKFVEVAASLPSRKAYPIMAWVIQNAVVRFARTDQALTHLRTMFEATLLGAELAGRVAARSSIDLKGVRRYAGETGEDNRIVFGAGDRERAVQYLSQWFQREVGTYLKICDEYFGPEDLEVLKLLISIKPTCQVSILTSQKHHNQEQVSHPVEAYREQWRRLSDLEAPDAEIVIVGLASSKKSPIHDRWWITDGGGLSIGTSYNSLGLTQESTITPLSNTQFTELEEEIDRYLNKHKREYNGEKLEYISFTL